MQVWPKDCGAYVSSYSLFKSLAFWWGEWYNVPTKKGGRIVKKTGYIIGALVCAMAMVLSCTHCGAPADTTTTTTTTTTSATHVVSTSPTVESTTVTTTAQDTTRTTQATTTTTRAPTTTKKTITTSTSKQQPETTTQKTTTTTKRNYQDGFPDVEVEISELESYMLELINAGRAKEGLPSLKMNTYYHDLAEIRAEEAHIEWSHTRPDGTTWWTIFEEYDREPSGYTAGENLACGFTDTKESMESTYDALYASEGHRATMMHPTYTEVSIAIYWYEQESNGETQRFGVMSQLFIGSSKNED